MSTQTHIKCNIDWDISISNFFADTNFPSYEEITKFFCLPKFVDIESDMFLFDACASKLKERLENTHEWRIDSIKCDSKLLKAEIIWDSDIDYFFDKIEPLSKEFLCSKANLPASIDLPEVFALDVSSHKDNLPPLLDKIKSHIEKDYGHNISNIKLEEGSSRDTYRASHIRLMYTAYTYISIDCIQEELDMSWEDVADYHVKWDNIYITMKDGRELQYSFESDCEIDSKYPDCTDID